MPRLVSLLASCTQARLAEHVVLRSHEMLGTPSYAGPQTLDRIRTMPSASFGPKSLTLVPKLQARSLSPRLESETREPISWRAVWISSQFNRGIRRVAVRQSVCQAGRQAVSQSANQSVSVLMYLNKMHSCPPTIVIITIFVLAPQVSTSPK